MTIETIDYRNRYGAQETNGLPEGGQATLLDQLAEDGHLRISWDDPQLAKVTRLRLLTDPGFPFWDVSYCYGVLKDGRSCRVDLPFSQLPKRGRGKFIVDHARAAGVYAAGLGLFDPTVVSEVY